MTLLLTIAEIKDFLEQDKTLGIKSNAKKGQDYYEGRHDILDYRMFYYNDDGNLVEDTYRSNVKIPHPFFTELVDQATQFVMSGCENIVNSNEPKLQKELDRYFNKNKRFKVELAETITGMQAKGFDYMYAHKDKEDKLAFENADCLGVVEVEGRFAEDGKDQYIYKYLDRIDKDGKKQWKVLVMDDTDTYYYIQKDNGDIIVDDDAMVNPEPHGLYVKDGKLFVKDTKLVPFFRLENNKKKTGLLPAVKPLIDDYDLMASSLTNNLIDFDTPLHVVKGFKGDNLDQLQQNLKTKKVMGTPIDGGVEVHTVDVPYEARKAKLELDEKSIYRFGMGLNMSGLKDTAATTNIAIKAAYSLLELRCNKIIDQLELFLQQIVEVVLNEINEKNNTAYQLTDVEFDIKPEIMSNSTENAQVDLTDAQKRQADVNTLLSVATMFDNETVMKKLCELLDVDYNEIKSKLPNPEEAENSIEGAIDTLGGGVVE